jgi:hypothetical protein
VSDDQPTPETDAVPDPGSTALAVAEAPASAPAEPSPSAAPPASAEPTASATAPTAVEAPTPAPAPDPVAAPAASPRPKRGSVQVPVWLLAVLGVLVIGVGAFFVGRETASSSSGTSGPDTLAEAVEMTARGDMEMGDFDVATLLEALRENDELDLGVLEDLILDQIRGR